MDKQDVLRKLAQIEEQARDALTEHPHLSRERLRLIAALARFLRAEIGADSNGLGSAAGLRANRGDDENASSG